MSNLRIRFAEEKDLSLIFNFIKDLAEYEKLSDTVVATEDLIFDSLFIKKTAEVIIAEYQGLPAGFAVFFHNFSTFIGKRGLYLEDLFVKPEFRGKGIGKGLLVYLAKLAVKRNCERFEWAVLDWNESAINFYKSLDAQPMDGWTVFRLSGHYLKKLAKNL